MLDRTYLRHPFLGAPKLTTEAAHSAMTLNSPPPSPRLDDLPAELIRHILTYLDHRTLTRASAASKSFHGFCSDQYQWRRLCEENGLIVKTRAGVYAYPTLVPAATTIPKSSAQPTSCRANEDWYQFFASTWKLGQNWRSLCCERFELPLAEYAYEGHESDIYALQVQGKYLVSGSLDKTLRIWDLDTFRLVGEPLRGHREEVLCLQFDWRRHADVIISGGSKGELISWRFSTTAMINNVDKAHRDAITGLKFDQSVLVTASKDMTIKIWQLSTLCTDSASPIRPLNTLTGHLGPVNAIDLSGDTIVSASADRTVKVWSILQGVCLNSVQEPRSIACVYFDGRTIITGGKNKSLRIYDHCLQSKISASIPHDSQVRTVSACLNISSTGIIATGSHDGSVRIWTRTAKGKWRSKSLDAAGAWLQTAASHTEHSTLHEGQRRILSLHSDNRRLACCPDSSKIVGWDFASGN